MNSERELFLEWMKSQPHVLNVGINPDGSFMLKEDQIAWLAWQASANRHGYKLVPVEPTQEMLDKFPEVVYQDTYAGECSIWVGDETIRSGYKAMIGE